MGYFTSLIQRKFKDVAGTRYDTVMKEYREFLLTEEERKVPEVRSILMPLDYFVKEVPSVLYDTLSSYEGATVSLVYIIDLEVIRIVEDSLNADTVAEFKRKREAYGEEILRKTTADLERAGLPVKSRMFSGSKFENIAEVAESHDLIAVSKKYAASLTEVAAVSPVTLRLAQTVAKPIIIY
jgi:nucleotide-binding universal stress UspA family protein